MFFTIKSMRTGRPIRVMIIQGLLVLAAFLYLSVPFLSVIALLGTFDYYGVSPSDARNELMFEFLIWLLMVSPLFVLVIVASWGMIKGTRTGRILVTIVFTVTATCLILDILDPSTEVSLTNVGLSRWVDVGIKLVLATTFFIFDVLIYQGQDTNAFFAKPSSELPEPPPPPSFDD